MSGPGWRVLPPSPTCAGTNTVLANPRIRVKNREKAEMQVGKKVSVVKVIDRQVAAHYAAEIKLMASDMPTQSQAQFVLEGAHLLDAEGNPLRVEISGPAVIEIAV